jgi:hypothetical protein
MEAQESMAATSPLRFGVRWPHLAAVLWPGLLRFGGQDDAAGQRRRGAAMALRVQARK